MDVPLTSFGDAKMAVANRECPSLEHALGEIVKRREAGFWCSEPVCVRSGVWKYQFEVR